MSEILNRRVSDQANVPPRPRPPHILRTVVVKLSSADDPECHEEPHLQARCSDCDFVTLYADGLHGLRLLQLEHRQQLLWEGH